MRSNRLKKLGITAVMLWLCSPLVLLAQDSEEHAPKKHPLLVTFDAPDAGKIDGAAFCFGNCPGTAAVNANRNGDVTGYYVDDSSAFHGFVRNCDGKLTEFDAPGATGAGTIAYSINSEGAIAGLFQDANGIFEGFLRSPNGHFTTFTIPHESFGPGQGLTGAANINDEGEIAGYFTDSNIVNHGFLRHADGKIETFDVAAAGTSPNFPPQGTVVALESGLSGQGAITGWYFDSSQATHGYVRGKDGAIKTFDDALGGNGLFQGTLAGSINSLGEIAGGVLDINNVYHGFVRSRDGAITNFDAPGAGNTPGQYQGTFAVGINDAREITAYVTDNNNLTHGAVRDTHGHILLFDVEAAGTGQGQGTTPQGINPGGAVLGYYTDCHNVNHGFLRLP